MISLPYLGSLPESRGTGNVGHLGTFNKLDISGKTLPFNPRVGESQIALGENISQFGVNMSRVASSFQQRQNEEADRIDGLIAADAVNKIKSASLGLSDGENGFRSLKGSQIVSNTQPIMKGYLDQYDATVKNVISDLSPMQQAKVKVHSDAERIDLSASFLRHAMQQSDQYSEDVYVGAISAEERAASVDWDNLGSINAAKKRVREVAESAFKGKPQDLIDAKVNDSYEHINAAVLAQAIANNNVEYAKQYMKNNNDQIKVEDLIKYSTKMAELSEDSRVNSTVQSLTGNLQQDFMPNDFMRLRSLVAHQESGNKDFYADGRAVQSPKGALYSMQTMPETAARPGYGIRPAQSGTPDEFNRVGTEKLAAMIRLFGNDVGKALGAYNWGEGRVKEAERKAIIYNSIPSKERLESGNKTWLDFAPVETQNYVRSISAKFNRGDVETKPPTLVDLKKAAEISMRGASPEALAKVNSRIEAAYNDNRQAVNQRQQDALFAMKDKVDNREILTMDDLSPDEAVAMGDKKRALADYIEGVNKKEQTILELSPEATSQYSALYHNPKYLTTMDPAEITAMAKDLGVKRVNSLLEKRQFYLSNPEEERKASVDEDQFKATAIKFGWGDSKSDNQQLILLSDRVKTSITDIETSRGKSLTREEKQVVLNGMFVEYNQVKTGKREPGFTRFLFGPDVVDSKRGYQVKDPSGIVIPDDMKVQIKNSFIRQGKNPTDSDILNVYSRHLAREQTGE